MVGKCTAPTTSALLRSLRFVPTSSRRFKAFLPALLTSGGSCGNRPTPPPAVAAAHRDRQVEAGGHMLRCDDNTEWAGGDQSAGAHEPAMGEPRRDLLTVVRHQDDGR